MTCTIGRQTIRSVPLLRSTIAGTGSACAATHRARSSTQHVHCRNCPVYSAAAVALLDRDLPRRIRRRLDRLISRKRSRPRSAARDRSSSSASAPNGSRCRRWWSTKSPSRADPFAAAPAQRRGARAGQRARRAAGLRLAGQMLGVGERRPQARPRTTPFTGALLVIRRDGGRAGLSRSTRCTASSASIRATCRPSRRRSPRPRPPTPGGAAVAGQLVGCSTTSCSFHALTGASHDARRSQPALDARSVPRGSREPDAGADPACSRSSATRRGRQLEACMRAAHSLKGAARIVGLEAGVAWPTRWRTASSPRSTAASRSTRAQHRPAARGVDLLMAHRRHAGRASVGQPAAASRKHRRSTPCCRCWRASSPGIGQPAEPTTASTGSCPAAAPRRGASRARARRTRPAAASPRSSAEARTASCASPPRT